MNSLYRAVLAATFPLLASLPTMAAFADAPATQPATLLTPHHPPAAGSLGMNPDPDRYLFEDALSPGMKGYGLTVMHGGKIEKFDVEIIDVVKNFTPGNNAILVRCSGLGLEHSGIIAGMSGSPVFIQDKMIGAVAYGWGMSKDPIGGVQPIRQMLAIRTTDGGKMTASAGGERWGKGGLLAAEAARMPGWKALTTSLAHRVGGLQPAVKTPEASPLGLRPLASPLMVGGGSSSTLALLQQGLAGTGLVPVASGSAGATPTIDKGSNPLGGLAEIKAGEINLAPGSAIALPLVTGDMDLSAIGTVTEVHDGKVYAFGHSFMGEGGTQLPIATSYIYTIMPNVSQSFKMGTSVLTDGTLVTDEQTGIVGVRGKAPATVPISVAINGGSAPGAVHKTYHYQLAPHPRLTPELLNAILNETMVAQRTLPQQFTARMTGKVVFAGTDGSSAERTIPINNLGAGQSFNLAMTLLPIAVLADNPFQNLKLQSLTLNAAIESTNRSATIQTINVDRLAAAPGDEVTAIVDMATFQHGTKRVALTVQVPKDAEDGDYELSVGSSSTALMQEAEAAPQRFDPQDIDGLMKAVERITGYQADHLYATLQMNVSGASVRGHEWKDLPTSRLAVYASDRRTDTAPLIRTVRSDVEAGYVVTDGGQTFPLHVDRNADRRYFDANADGNPRNRKGGPTRNMRVPVSAPAPASEPSDPDN